MLVVNYLVPLFVGILLLLASSFGFSGEVTGDVTAWCWIDPDHRLFELTLFYAPATFIFLSIILLYFPILRELKYGFSSMKGRVQKRLFMYIVVFAFCMLPGLINRVHQFFSSQPIFYIIFMNAFMFPSQGLWNSIVYSQRRALKKEIAAWWSGRKPLESEMSRNIE